MVDAPRVAVLPFWVAGFAVSLAVLSVAAGLPKRLLPAAAGVEVDAGAVVVVLGCVVAAVVDAVVEPPPPKRPPDFGAAESVLAPPNRLDDDVVAVVAGAGAAEVVAELPPKRPPLAGAVVVGVADLAPNKELPVVVLAACVVGVDEVLAELFENMPPLAGAADVAGFAPPNRPPDAGALLKRLEPVEAVLAGCVVAAWVVSCLESFWPNNPPDVLLCCPNRLCPAGLAESVAGGAPAGVVEFILNNDLAGVAAVCAVESGFAPKRLFPVAAGAAEAGVLPDAGAEVCC